MDNAGNVRRDVVCETYSDCSVDERSKKSGLGGEFD
jgi:hypothetical protein